MGRREDRSGSAYIEQTPYTGSPTDERADECDDAGVRLVTKIEFGDCAVLIDASILGEGLGLEASLVPMLMRKAAITSLCERGIDSRPDRGRDSGCSVWRRRLSILSLQRLYELDEGPPDR